MVRFAPARRTHGVGRVREESTLDNLGIAVSWPREEEGKASCRVGVRERGQRRGRGSIGQRESEEGRKRDERREQKRGPWR